MEQVITVEVVSLLIANLPNFAGFIVATAVLYSLIKQISDDYAELVMVLVAMLKQQGKTSDEVLAMRIEALEEKHVGQTSQL